MAIYFVVAVLMVAQIIQFMANKILAEAIAEAVKEV